LSKESGMDPEIRREILKAGFNGTLEIETSMEISPTGFPFSVANLPGSISDPKIYEARRRVCDLCVLVSCYKKPDGSIGYRCPSEPTEHFVHHKGGKMEDTIKRGCVCNGLITTAGLRFENENHEPAIVTLGDDVSFLKHLMKNEDDSYSAVDAIRYLFGE